MYKLYTELPLVKPEKMPLFDKHRIYGAIFLFVVFTGLIYLIYEWKEVESKKNVGCIQVLTTAQNPTTREFRTFATPCDVPRGWQISLEVVDTCIQVITPARNKTTGEIKEFPNPCVVPEGWEKLQ